MLKNIYCGTMAGAVGTMALDIVSSLDMSVRGRTPSGLPAKVVQKLAQETGLPNALAASDEQSSEAIKNQRSGIGSLMGYGVGLSVGGIYGLTRPSMRFIPWPVAGICLGAAAMAASDVPATRLNVTDPAKWTIADWASDIVPHLAYGLVTALAFEAFDLPNRGLRRAM